MNCFLPAVPLYWPQRSMSRALERIISQFKAWEFIIQILYILFLHKSRVTTLDMAWQLSWCDMSKVRPEYIIRIKIRAKTFSQNLDFEPITFLLNCPLSSILFNFSLIVTFQKHFAAQDIVFPSFGQFFPGKTGKNRFIPVYPILDGKNRFWTGKTQPCYKATKNCLRACSAVICNISTTYGVKQEYGYWLFK